MKDIRVSVRYATSLMELSLEQKNIEKVYNDMLLVQKTLENSRELVLLLESPIVDSEKKSKILNEIFSTKVEKITLSFMAIIIRKGRENLLPDIVAAFIEKYKDYKGIETVSVTSAVVLNDKARKELIENMAKQLNKTIELEEKIDEKIIGGFILRNKGNQIDRSIKRQLKDIEKQFILN